MNLSYILLSEALEMAFRGKMDNLVNADDFNQIIESYPTIIHGTKDLISTNMRQAVNQKCVYFRDIKNLVLLKFCKENNLNASSLMYESVLAIEVRFKRNKVVK
jgi:hypothetical protein